MPGKQFIEKPNVLQIYCLGVFRVVRPGESEIVGISSKHKMWALFKYLIAHKGTAIPTEEIINLLWPGNNNPSDTKTLRTTVSRLKSLLEPTSIIYQKSSYIIYCKESCLFNIQAAYWLDIDEFENLCATAHRLGNNDRKAAIDLYFEAFELYKGDFLAEDLDSEWALLPREYYRRLLIESAIEAASLLIEIKDFSRGYRLLKKVVKIDPYVEELQILLMKTLLGLKNLKAAAEHYSYCSSLLYKELGVKPSEEWKQLYKQIREAEGHTTNNLILEGALEQVMKGNGPLVCEPEFFWTCLLFERRRIARNGGESSLVILELSLAKDHKTNIYEKAAACLESVIYQKLRISDMVCKLDNNHFALLLPFTGAEGSETAVSQINDDFFRQPDNSGLALQVKTKRVTPL